jgi:hypothetical protein
MRKGCGGRRVCQIVGRHIDGLHARSHTSRHSNDSKAA